MPIFAFPGRVIKKTVTRPGDFTRYPITVAVCGGNCDFLLGYRIKKSLYAAVDQTAPKQAQSFRFATHNRADMLYCASFPQWEAGVFALLRARCRGPPRSFLSECSHSVK